MLIFPFTGWCALSTAQDSIPTIETALTVTDDTSTVRKVLFIGDSMTGWMAERLNAYGDKDGFEVATVVWDGSTIQKWANSPNLGRIIREQHPDAVFISLGMNELFEKNPQTRLKQSLDKLKKTIGDIPMLWIGPPSWPGHNEGEILDSWLNKELGDSAYFRSLDLDLPRQSKSNPHPSREGIATWIDTVAEWIPMNSGIKFKSLAPPEGKSFLRGKVYIYKKMNEQL